MTLQPCAYGFVDVGQPQAPNHSEWGCLVQRVFRGNWLWLWGGPDAELTSLKCGVAEQLVIPSLPFHAMDRDLQPEDFLHFVERKQPQTPKNMRVVLIASRISPLLCKPLGQPSWTLPTIEVGQTLSFRFRGAVRGVVLVGDEAL